MKTNVNGSLGKNNTLRSASAGGTSGAVFFLLCLWTIVNLSRPQDIFLFLVPLRPALTLGVITLFFFFLNYNNKSLVVVKDKQVRFFLFLVLIMIIGIPFSLHPRWSIEFVFLRYMLIVSYFIVFVVVVDSLERLYRVLFLGCIGNGIYMAYGVLTWSSGSDRIKFGGMFDPNDLSFFALCFIPLNLIFISKDNNLLARILCVIFFFLGIVLIFLTGSRGGALGLGIAALAIFFRATASISKQFKVFAIIAMTLILSMSAINFERVETLLSFESIEQDYNITAEGGRLDIWKSGLKAMFRNPMTGVGVGCFQMGLAYERRIDPSSSLSKWQSSHNAVVQIGTETGVFGLMLFLMLSWNVVKIFARISREATSIKLKKVGEMGLAGFMGMFTAAFFLSQAYSIYWAFYIMFSAVAFRLLSNELAVEGKKATP